MEIWFIRIQSNFRDILTFFQLDDWIIDMNPTPFFFLVRTSNFGVEAERSYYFWQFEPEKFLRCS